jgi:nicotinamidase-related amidase
MMTHMCVDTTVRAAFDIGLACTLAHDACATRDLAFGRQTATAEQVQTAYVAALGALFARALAVEEIVAQL